MKKLVKYIPNILTLSRIFLCPMALYLLFQNKTLLAAILFSFGAVSDFLDGFIARKFSCSTKLGGLLDPVADKIILVSFFTSLMALRISPPWFTGLVFSVNLLQIIGYLALNLPSSKERVQFTTLKIGKINTFLQYLWIACLVAIQLLHIPYSEITVWFRWIGHGSLALLQIATFIHYFHHFRIHLGQDFKSVYQR